MSELGGSAPKQRGTLTGKHVLLTVLMVVICISLPAWMMFGSGKTISLANDRVFTFIAAVFCLIPIYPLFRRARYRNRLAVIAVGFVIASLMLTAVDVLGSSVLPFDTPWISVLSKLRNAAFLSACLLLILNFLMKKSSAA
jgi:hypothetical protein